MLKFSSKSAIPALASLAVPGLGHVIKGRWLLGLWFQAIALGGAVLICLSRLIIQPYGLEILAIFMAIILISSSIATLILPEIASNTWRRGVAASAFLVASLALALGLFISKEYAMGIHVYYIPSASMYPSLQPGDLIIVDTWAYRDAAPEIDDIVTFTLPGKPEYVMVKRIAGTEEGGASYILLGDNPNNSGDSRRFGAVPRTLISGKVIRTIDILRP